MANLIPERPLYRRERLIVGFPLLVAFALTLLARLLFDLLPLPALPELLKLLPMIAALLVPALIFWMLRGGRYTRYMRFHAPRVTHLPFLISSFFVLLSGSLLLSMLFGGTETLGNSTVAFEAVHCDGPLDTVLKVLVTAVVPALTEELFFRGIVVTEYERRGAIRAVLMSALTFSLCHFDLRNLPVYLFSGVLFALVLFATDSLIATMLLHLCYNLFSLFGQQYLNAFYSITGGVELFVFSLIVVLLLSLVIFCGLGSRIYHLREQGGRKDPRRSVPWNVQFYTILDALSDPPLLLCLVISVVGFIVL
ncbi:MAG: CPBP family intramembrane metalloprotease [Clostridia bacterium]|nr:CPBP family intramembrane metalloprotease [Clostridia bacterium]